MISAYEFSGKDLDTLDTVQVWDSVRSNTNLQDDLLKMLGSQKIQGIQEEELVKQLKKTKLLENAFFLKC